MPIVATNGHAFNRHGRASLGRHARAHGHPSGAFTQTAARMGSRFRGSDENETGAFKTGL